MRLALSKKYETMQLRLQKCMASHVFKDPMRIINDRYVLIDKYIKQLQIQIQTKHQQEKQKYVALLAKLDTLSPLKTLSRGYCLTELEGKVITRSKDLKKDMEVDLVFCDGKTRAKVI